MIALLLTGNEHRGNDATGIALSQADGSVQVFKKATIAWKFVEDKEYEEFLNKNLRPDTWGALLHTRYATRGNPKDNNNNHPMYAGKSAVIHNGTLFNDDTLFHSRNFKRKSETDSDILRAFVDEYGITEECIKEMCSIGGSAAGAAFHPKYPQKMLLFRSGSPMTLGSTDEFFLFSSEQGTAYKALRPYVKRFNMWFQLIKAEAGFSPMAADTAWIIGPKGYEAHAKFETMTGKYIEPNRRTYEGYEERQKQWANKPCLVSSATQNQFDDATCPKCRKNWTIPYGMTPGDYTCNPDSGGCGSTLISVERAKSSGKTGVN
jgi:Glutamine amidotransferase domain